MTRPNDEPASRPRGIGRRRFVAGLGIGAASAFALNDVEALAEMVEGPLPTSAPDHRFSRMFRLPAFADPTSAAVRDAMIDIGKPGGLLDAKDPLVEGPIPLVTNPELRLNNPDQDIRNMTAGTTFLKDDQCPAHATLGHQAPIRAALTRPCDSDRTPPRDLLLNAWRSVDLEAWVIHTRLAQGLPARVEDPTVLALIADLICPLQADRDGEEPSKE
ncbi:MAG: hypothetical protein ACRDRA_03995 [Pseudonocardiaceae bacterium]